jgi:hypothetical protein
LIGKYPSQHLTSLLQVTSLSHNRCRHRVITTNTHTHQHPEHEDPDHLQSRCRNAVRKADGQYRANNADDKLLAIHELAAKCVTKVAENKLSEDVSDVTACVDEPTKAWRIMRFLVLQPAPISIRLSIYQRILQFDAAKGKCLLVLPYWCDQVDDEQVIGVKEEANSSTVLVVDHKILIG